jgi:hypothetical protein
LSGADIKKAALEAALKIFFESIIHVNIIAKYKNHNTEIGFNH